MIKAVIFDLDGTLLNTLEDIHCVLNESLSEFGLDQVTLSQTKSYVGNGAARLIELAAGEKKDEIFDKLYSYYSERFAECGNEHTKLYDGEEQVLNALKKAGISLAIVTNKPQRAAENVYGKFLSEFGFCKVLGQTAERPLKPNPSSVLTIIEELNIKKEECIFVGDGEADVLTAKAAEIKCISVLWGFRTKKQLEAVGAEHFAEKYSEILSFIDK